MNDAISPDQLMRSVLQRIATGPELSKDISLAEARDVMTAVLDENVDAVRAGVFLIALRMKRETDDELRGVLQAVRDATSRAVASVDEVVDIVDPYDGFNRNLLVSPFLPAVLAACGVASFSHGVPSVGPKYGATHARVLSAAGVNVDRTPAEVSQQLSAPGIGWGYVDQKAFCPKLHNLIGLRDLIVKRPAITTVEVLAGPVTGLRKTHFMTGYVHKPYPRIYALLARHAGFDSALLVRGIEGGITPSLSQKSKVWRYDNGADESDVDIEPAQLGIERTSRGVPLPEGITGDRRKSDDGSEAIDAPAMATAAAAAGLAALNNEPGPARDSLIYAGSLCLWHVGKTAGPAQAGELVRKTLASGKALSHFTAGQ
jgi:anthranilate phosphoribosyltransferase